MASDKINSLIDVKSVEKEIASTVDSLDKILQKMTAITAQAAKSGFIKNAKDIEQLTKASKELNAITEEQIALDKEVKKQKDALAAATAKLAALQTEEAKALEEARQKTAEATRELKNRVAAERAAEGSIAKMRGELNALTAQYDKLSQEERENISVGGKMQSQIKGLSDALKQLEHQTGRDQRNVGNYAEAIDIATMSLGQLKQELRALRNQPLTGATPEQLAATEARMAELTDAVGDYSARIKTAGDKTQLMIEAGQGLIAVAQFGTATMSMFGIENEKLEKSMVQLIGVAQGLATIHQLNEKQVFKSALATAKDTYAKIANTVATYANARANEASTKVMSGLWKVIAANPMTALVLGIAAVTAGLIALVNALRPAKSTLDSLAESQKAVFDSAFETVGSLEAYRSIIMDTTRTERERTAAMNAYNKIAKEQGLATVSLTMSTAELNAAMDENLKRVYATAAATAAMNEMTAKFAELIKLRAIQQKYADENIGLRSAIQQKIDETNEEIKSLQSLYLITTSYTEGVKQGTDKVNLLVKGMEKINEETKKDTDNTTKASKARRKMNEDLKLHMESINSASDQLKKLADEEASYVAKATKRQTELTNNTIGDLKKMLQEGTITADEYETKVGELAQARLDMERYNFRELKRLRDEDMISEEQYLKARNEALMAYGDAAMGVLTAGFQFVDAQQEAELSKFKEGQDKKLESLQNALNNNIISQQAYDVQKAAIEKETEKREKIMARNKAKRERADALFSIGISTSKAIMAIWADLTLSTIAKGIFTALVAAQGALQTAAVASKPLPAYEKGGTVRETGLALVSEKGSELIDTGAGMFITPSMPTIMPLNAGWKVTPADKTAQMLNSGEIVSKLDAVERAITNKREFGINVTEQGFYVVAKRGNSRQTYINKKFKN